MAERQHQPRARAPRARVRSSCSSAWCLADRAAATQEITNFEAKVSGTQAGGHPNVDYVVSWTNRQGSNVPCNCEDARILDMHFPTGFIGNPHNVPACSLTEFSLHECSPDSQVGVSRGSRHAPAGPVQPGAPCRRGGPGRLLHPGSRNTSLHRSARPHRVRLRARRDQLRRSTTCCRSPTSKFTYGEFRRTQATTTIASPRAKRKGWNANRIRGAASARWPPPPRPRPTFRARLPAAYRWSPATRSSTTPGRSSGRRRLARDDGLRPAHLQSEPHCDADHRRGRQRRPGST